MVKTKRGVRGKCNAAPGAHAGKRIPFPIANRSRRGGQCFLAGILLVALVAAGIGFLGRTSDDAIPDDRVRSYSNDVTVFVGTRPEVIKLAPVVEGLAHLGAPPRVVSTGQHATMLTETAQSVGLKFTDQLKWKRKTSDLKDLFAEIFKASYDYLRDERPRLVVIQGDTTTALAVGLAAAHLHVDVAHVEAGLRTFDPENPFPEETNRVHLDHLSSLLFAPTTIAESNLLNEGICPDRIFMVGNTVVDSLNKVRASVGPHHGAVRSILQRLSGFKRLVLVTCHRREAYGEKMGAIFAGIKAAADQCQHQNACAFIFPVHKSPVVQKAAKAVFGTNSNVLLVPPLDYQEMVSLYQGVHLIVTDSGGIQEEATSLGIHTIVVREQTERPEGILAGILDLVPPNASVISKKVLEKIWIDNAPGRNTDTSARAIYGNGDSGLLIAEKVREYVSGRPLGHLTKGCAPRVLQSKSISSSLFSGRETAPANRQILRSPSTHISDLMKAPSAYSGETKEAHDVTVIVSFYRRINTVDRILDALLQQDHSPKEVWAYVFGSPMQADLAERLRKYKSQHPSTANKVEIFEATKSLGYHGRFQLGLQVTTPYVAIFDDDCIPGSRFIANALHIMNIGLYKGIFGVKGHDAGPYIPNEPIFGAGPLPKSETLEEVEIVGGAWIMQSDHLKLLFRRKPYTWSTGEDMQLCHAMRTVANYSCYVLPADYSDPSTMGTSDLQDYLKISEEGDTTYVTVTGEERVSQEAEFFLAGDRRARWMQLLRTVSNCRFLVVARTSDALEGYATNALSKVGSMRSCSNLLWFSAVTDSASHRELPERFALSGKLDLYRDFDHNNSVFAISLMIEKLHAMLEMVQPAAVIADSRSLRPEELQGILTSALIEQQCAILIWCSTGEGWPKSVPRYLKDPSINVWCPGERDAGDLSQHLEACLAATAASV